MRYRMGDLVEQVTEVNSDLKYGLNDIVGVTLEKQMIPTIANLTQTNLDNFIIVHPKDFVYNPRTHGKKIGLGFNTTDRCFISTWNNNTFRVKPEMSDVIMPEYLYMYFLREKWDKEACFNAWGSSTVVLLWSSFCDMKINVPSLPEQRKIVHDYQVITDRIELLRKMNEKLEEQEDAIFQDFYSDDSLNEGHFSDLVVDNIPGDWGSDSATGNTNEQVTCIRGADIPRLANGGTDNAPTRYILQKNYLSKSLPANALIIEISGGSPTQSTGRIALLTDELRAKLNRRVICSNFCKAITVKEDFLYFFYLAWRHLYKANRLFDYENSTIGLKNFDYQSFVTQEAIRIPTAEGGRRLNAMIEPIRKAIILNGFESEKLMALQNVVLSNIMR
jgi:type I restriction enzyme S subunit